MYFFGEGHSSVHIYLWKGVMLVIMCLEGSFQQDRKDQHFVMVSVISHP